MLGRLKHIGQEMLLTAREDNVDIRNKLYNGTNKRISTNLIVIAYLLKFVNRQITHLPRFLHIFKNLSKCLASIFWLHLKTECWRTSDGVW